MRTDIKKVEVAIASKDAEKAGGSLQDALRTLDKSASKGIIHKNQAARKKSNLTRKVNQLSAGA
jgi:small subunit ribosomal protein S20